MELALQRWPVYPETGNRDEFNGSHNRCGWFRRKDKFIAPTGIGNTDRSARSLVTTPNWFLYASFINWAISSKMRANEIWFSKQNINKINKKWNKIYLTRIWFLLPKKFSFLGKRHGENSVRSIDRLQSLPGPLSLKWETTLSYSISVLYNYANPNETKTTKCTEQGPSWEADSRSDNKFPWLTELQNLTSWL
jgi:hypothetical protein